eukprot:CAMPEP_0114341468 /NCGR_PEP_ID=MMETSP0101-20121206/9068_1 /TAXON_ID=38822 ORGANISM="Pteridomonas danica, Strain PT" /NCGR_SAMPLE_ID=MMETSP0101 /ASSEMBLY_ACC=CAM_ASM_000211 /LENGTH=193 /DNA_ID=CAMNT_0001475083 /DNA_START=410 /DNA_END=991 /DNA_ORIENTATION=+
MITPMYRRADAFRGYEGYVIALINSLFDAGSATGAFLLLVYNAGVSRQVLFGTFGFLSILFIPITFLITKLTPLPNQVHPLPLKNEKKMINDDDEELELPTKTGCTTRRTRSSNNKDEAGIETILDSSEGEEKEAVGSINQDDDNEDSIEIETLSLDMIDSCSANEQGIVLVEHKSSQHCEETTDISINYKCS